MNQWDNIKKSEKGRFTYHSPTSFEHLKYNNRYSKLKLLERISRNFVLALIKAAPRFEAGAKFERYCLLSIETTTKSNKVLEELSEQIYRLQIDTNRLDPSEF